MVVDPTGYTYMEVTTEYTGPSQLKEGSLRQLEQTIYAGMKPKAYQHCLVSTCNDAPTVGGHVIPRSWMKRMCVDDHVIVFLSTRLKPEPVHEAADRTLSLDVHQEHVNTATTRHFTCQEHEQIFFESDSPDPDMRSTRVLNRMAYKIVIAQLWAESAATKAYEECLRMYPADLLAKTMLRHYREAVQGLKHYRRQLEQCLDPSRCSRCRGSKCEVIGHVVRHISGKPTLAAAQFSNGLRSKTIDDAGHQRRQANWGLTVVPTEYGHSIALHYFLEDVGKSSLLDQAINNYKTLHGRRLEEFVSVDIIDYTEGFVISPLVWEQLGHKRKDSIVRRFCAEKPFYGVGTDDDFTKYYTEMINGRLTPPNPRQLNLFRY